MSSWSRDVPSRRYDNEVPINPEVVRGRETTVDPGIERLVRLMDEAIRIGPLSFGLDGVLGLIPGFGDLASGLISTYIVWRAAKAGVPRATVARMMVNVAIDSILGAVPFLGDVFDFLYKANAKNLRLYEEAIKGRRKDKSDWAFVIIAVLSVIAAILIPIAAAVLLVRRLW